LFVYLEKTVNIPMKTYFRYKSVVSCALHGVVGRGMNAAFAIGRLCDMDAGVVRLLSLPMSDKMVRI
jgi:hypothetical protein